jgi:hypothetical protein
VEDGFVERLFYRARLNKCRRLIEATNDDAERALYRALEQEFLRANSAQDPLRHSMRTGV